MALSQPNRPLSYTVTETETGDGAIRLSHSRQEVSDYRRPLIDPLFRPLYSFERNHIMFSSPS